MTDDVPDVPFTDSRRLLGANPYFAQVGAALEANAASMPLDLPGDPLDTANASIITALLDGWCERVERARSALGWDTFAPLHARAHHGGATLALAAPLDGLFTATEINEWAWEATLLSFPLRGKVPAGRMREDHPRSHEPSRKKLPFDDDTRAFIHKLRHEATDAEQLVWFLLRDRRLDGAKFRRQHAIGPYVLDFYCHQARLAVELDGGQHGDPGQIERDQQRNAFVASKGIRTLRFWNDDVLLRTEDVLAEIWRAVQAEESPVMATGESFPSSALRAPSPGGGRESMSATAIREDSPSSAPGSSLGQALRAPSPGGGRESMAVTAIREDSPSSALRAPSPGGGRNNIAWQLPHAPGHPAAWDDEDAFATLRELARSEANPKLLALAQAACDHGVEMLMDDTDISLGEGHGARAFPLDPLPDPTRIRWSSLHDVPVALVTGTNGKTTTVRLLAAMARAHGWSTGHSCTDGLFVDGRPIASGDYSGPAGARQVLRQPEVQCAILETARGGILRRGLAMQRAQAAVVTNLSADHYGSYGVFSLDDLARVKLTVARVLDRGGLLVLNADDATLRAHAGDVDCAIGWFALDDDHPLLIAHRTAGGATCGVREGRIVLRVGGVAQELGIVTDMPITIGGAARYNVANILGAALAATALGIPATTIAGVLARFGTAHADNPGRLQRWTLAGIEVWLDYAHNPDGLRGLLEVVGVAQRSGRFGLLLGQAGDRSDEDIRELARVAAHFRPDRVVLKDMPAFMRGRAPGEVAAILCDGLVHDGVPAAAIDYATDEEPGARSLLDWAQPGDILVLPVHAKAARAQVSGLLDRMASLHWLPGQTLP
ncbi:MAG: DUF559 domain-containing protein [Proteobacteria bacterium]|nr:DUF559 domain-containing protein [Pseudomonadota bacterium]